MENEKVVLGYSDIPDVPELLSKIFEMVRAQGVAYNDIADVMCYEKPLSDFLLRYANYLYCDISNENHSKELSNAITRLGVNRARNIILTCAIKPFLVSCEKEYLWTHSLRSAIGCRKLAVDFDIMQPEDAYLLGLLHDVGKIVLNEKSPSTYDKVLDSVHKGLDILEVENSFFGKNHCDIGYIFAKKWQFPSSIIEGIKYHHMPNIAENSKVSYLVYAADCLAQEDFDEGYLQKDLLAQIGIHIDNFSEYRRNIFAVVAELTALFS